MSHHKLRKTWLYQVFDSYTPSILVSLTEADSLICSILPIFCWRIQILKQ